MNKRVQRTMAALTDIHARCGSGGLFPMVALCQYHHVTPEISVALQQDGALVKRGHGKGITYSWVGDPPTEDMALRVIANIDAHLSALRDKAAEQAKLQEDGLPADVAATLRRVEKKLDAIIHEFGVSTDKGAAA